MISAVGHETDWTLIDLVADARAPTPTKAAEWAVPKYADLVEQQAKLADRLRISVLRVVDSCRTHLKAAARGLPRLHDLIALPRQRFDAVERRLTAALVANTNAHGKRLARVAPRLQPRLIAIRIERSSQRLQQMEQRARAGLARITGQRRNRFERAGGRLSPELVRGRLVRARDALQARAGMLSSLSYQSVLARGFALVRDVSGATVRSVAQATAAGRLNVQVADGAFEVDVAAVPSASASASEVGKPPRTSVKPKFGPGGQGSLF